MGCVFHIHCSVFKDQLCLSQRRISYQISSFSSSTFLSTFRLHFVTALTDSFSFLQQLIYINRIFFSCPVLFQIQFDIYFTDKQQAIPLPQERSIYNVRRISFEHIIMHNQVNNFDCLYICTENKRMPK